jgi:hypothetical protein
MLSADTTPEEVREWFIILCSTGNGSETTLRRGEAMTKFSRREEVEKDWWPKSLGNRILTINLLVCCLIVVYPAFPDPWGRLPKLVWFSLFCFSFVLLRQF